MVLVRGVDGDVVHKKEKKTCAKETPLPSVDLTPTRPITDVEALYIVQAMREQK